jgi:hypothetical protein
MTACAAFVAGLAAVAAVQEPAPTTLDEALRRGRAENRLVLVEFTHPW